MATAGEILANTPELIEMILLNLPLRDILLAQRVNWTFESAISTSPRLQQALFFKPISSDSVRFKHDWSNIRDCTNKEHCDRLDETLTALNEDSNTWIWSDSGRPFRGHLFLNPWFASSTPLVPRDPKGPFWQRITTSVLGMSKENAVEPSFKRMLFTQPPLVELVVDHGQANHWHSLKAKDPGKGLTGDDVVKSVKAFDSEFVGIFRDGYFRRLCYDTEHPTLLSAAEVLARLEGM